MSLFVDIAIDGLVRTGCRGGTPGWGQSPHTPFDPSVLTFVATAIGVVLGVRSPIQCRVILFYYETTLPVIPAQAGIHLLDRCGGGFPPARE